MAEKAEGTDYFLRPGLGRNAILDAGGDALCFPVTDDPEIAAARKHLAALLISPEAPVSLNLVKGCLPVRGDIDMPAAQAQAKYIDILSRAD